MAGFLDGVGSFLKKSVTDAENGIGQIFSNPNVGNAVNNVVNTAVHTVAPTAPVLNPVHVQQPAQPQAQQQLLVKPMFQPRPSLPQSVGGNSPIQEFGDWAKNNIVQPTVNFGTRAYNTGAAGVESLAAGIALPIDKLTGDQQGYNNDVNTYKQQLTSSLGGKLDDGGSSGFLNLNDAANLKDPKVYAGNVLSTAGQVAPFLAGAGGKVVGEGLGVLGKIGGESLVNGLRIGGGSYVGDATSQAGNIIDGKQQSFNPGESLQAGLQGLAAGTALTGAHAGIRELSGKLPGTNNVVDAPPTFETPTNTPTRVEAATEAETVPQVKNKLTSLPTEEQAAALGGTPEQFNPVEHVTPAVPDDIKAEYSTMRLWQENTDRNPYKSDVTDVKQNNYDEAIQNAQKVEQDVRSKYLVAEQSLKRLPKKIQQEFGEYHEGTKVADNPNLQKKIDRASQDWQAVTDAIHAHSQALGGNTNYLVRYAPHPWDLPEDIETSEINGGGKNFQGLNSIERTHRTIQDGKDSGLTFSGDYMDVLKNYSEASARALKKEALRKGFAQADAGEIDKRGGGNLTLGQDDVIPISKKGAKYAKGVQYVPKSTNILLRSYRGLNRGIVKSLLSHTPVHQYNVTTRAVPGLVLAGHPLAGLQALAKGTAALADLSGTYSKAVFRRATQDGTAAKAAQIGMKYDTSGHGILWRGLIPVHDQVARTIIKELEDKGIPLNSKAARRAGNAGNNLMAQANFEALHVSPQASRAMGDVFLARQFTPSKFLRLKQAATEGGIGGKYARAGIVGDVVATTAIIGGLGYIFKQKSDDIRDVLLRALIDPAIPTPFKDSKGNTLEIKIPGTDTSDVAKLLGIKLVRQGDGHLGVSWNINNVPDTVREYFTSRLAPVAGDALKLASNENYANKPLYDPNAPIQTRIAQAATTLGVGSAPIYAQNLAYTQPVRDAIGSVAPDVKEVLDANSNNQNAALNTGIGYFGGTAKNDPTTGKGLQSTEYFSALDDAQKGLNNKEQAALELVTGSKRNPVTGAYDVMPNANDTRAKATALLDQPKALDRYIEMNKQLESQGQSIDPLFNLSHDQIVKYYQYQAMPPGSADRAQWQKDNASWYNQQLQDARGKFFNSLPPGDPNAPQSLIQAPKPTPLQQRLLDYNDTLTDPAQKAALFDANPELGQYFDALADYTNKMRVAQGFDPLRTAPKEDAATASFMKQYFASDSAGKKNLRAQFPEAYIAMQNYQDNMSRYSLDKAAAEDQLVPAGTENQAPGQTYLKNAFNLGQYAIGKGVDANGNTTYDYFPSTNNAAGSTTGANAAVKITGGGSAFNGIGGYKAGGGGGSYAKKQKKQKLRVKHKKVRYVYLKGASKKGPVKSIKIKHEVGAGKV